MLHDDPSDYTVPDFPSAAYDAWRSTGPEPWPSTGNSADPCETCGHTNCRCPEEPADFVAFEAVKRIGHLSPWSVRLPVTLGNEGQRWHSLPSRGESNYQPRYVDRMVPWERVAGNERSHGGWWRFPMPWMVYVFSHGDFERLCLDSSGHTPSWSLHRWTRTGRLAWLSDAGRAQLRWACVLLGTAIICALLMRLNPHL